MNPKEEIKLILLNTLKYSFLPDEKGNFPKLDPEEFAHAFGRLWSIVEGIMKTCYEGGYTKGVQDLHKSFLEEGAMPESLEVEGIKSTGEKSFGNFYKSLGIKLESASYEP